MLKIVNENRNYPREGFFWIIDDKVVGFADEVPQRNYEYSFKGKTHENTWNEFKSDYKVNGEEVSFDYYPRGRIMIDPNYDSDNNFTYYSVLIFMDNCIKDDKYKEMISDYYNLNLKTCHIMWMPSLKERAGIDHYTCHNCRDN